MTSASTDTDERRLDRQFAKLERAMPERAARVLRRLREPQARWIRIPAGVLLMLGGIFSVLPVLGLWMLPLGVMLLALDVPFLRRPTVRVMVWVERRWQSWRRRRAK